jgi:hypothetical protein
MSVLHLSEPLDHIDGVKMKRGGRFMMAAINCGSFVCQISSPAQHSLWIASRDPDSRWVCAGCMVSIQEENRTGRPFRMSPELMEGPRAFYN